MESKCFFSEPTKLFSSQNGEKTEWEYIFSWLTKMPMCKCTWALSNCFFFKKKLEVIFSLDMIFIFLINLNFLFLRLENLFGNSKWTKNKNCSQNSIYEWNWKHVKDCLLFLIFNSQWKHSFNLMNLSYLMS